MGLPQLLGPVAVTLVFAICEACKRETVAAKSWLGVWPSSVLGITIRNLCGTGLQQTSSMLQAVVFERKKTCFEYNMLDSSKQLFVLQKITDFSSCMCWPPAQKIQLQAWRRAFEEVWRLWTIGSTAGNLDLWQVWPMISRYLRYLIKQWWSTLPQTNIAPEKGLFQ